MRQTAVRRVPSGLTDVDLLAVEEPLHLEIEHGPPGARQRASAGIVMRTPGQDEPLAAGLLFAEGVIDRGRDIAGFERPQAGLLRVKLAPEVDAAERLTSRLFARTGACGICGASAIDGLQAGSHTLSAGPSVTHAFIRGLGAQLLPQQAGFRETGGMHAAAWFDAEGALLGSAEDIGRHNAVDKLTGSGLLTPPPTTPAVMVVSGRAAFEIVQKAVRARVPILAAVGAPSSLAVDTARAFNLTLVGFLRDDRFNVYSGFDRIV